MKKLFSNTLTVLTLVSTLLCSGCIYLVVGGLGALGGYVVSPDTVEGITDHDEMSVWNASVEIVSIMGIIQSQDESTGTLIAEVNNARVTIIIESLSDTATQLSVKARKFHLPRINTAQDIFVKIMSYLVE